MHTYIPVCYGSVGVQLTRLLRLNRVTLTSICVRKHLNATVLQVILAIFFIILVQAYVGGGKRVHTAQK